ncbi:hypothetical protein [Catalinimonas alkaloidigena]|nr:hypothetical protein [Catalinimonas alkaloidigena]
MYRAVNENDTRTSLIHFELITEALFQLTQSLFDKKVSMKYHQRELEGKFFRFGLANHSLINLIKGNRFNLINQEVSITDVFSINSITRMQIESFLIMFYLFFDKVSDSEKDFRYNIYKLHGLQKQASFKTSSTFPEKHVHLSKINSEIDESITNIKKSDLYRNASEKQRQAYLKPKSARLLSTKDLLATSGIEASRIDEMWQIYSNYAHSEHISDRQYNTIYSVEKNTLKPCSLIITINSILTSKLIIYLSELFKSIEDDYLKLNSKVKYHIDALSSIEISKNRQL